MGTDYRLHAAVDTIVGFQKQAVPNLRLPAAVVINRPAQVPCDMRVGS